MYPIKEWKTARRGYVHGQKTSYSAHHLGVDLIVPEMTKIFAPSDGDVTWFVGKEMGNTLFFRPDNKDVLMRFGHLRSFMLKGKVKKGDFIGLSGNTGTLTTGAHIHLDISKHALLLNNFSNFIFNFI